MPDLKILHVDDSKAMRGMILRQLHLAGFKQVVQAEGALEAIQKLETESFDILLSDWNMPTINGIEMVRMLREREEFKSLPVVMVTSRKEMEDIRTAAGAKVNGYLAKPFGPAELKDRIFEVLGIQESGGKPSAAEIRTQIKDLSDFPALSTTHVKLVNALAAEDESVDMDQLADILQADQGLSLRIMKIARSAYYGFTGDYLKTALTFLGLPKIRTIVQSATILEIYKETEGAGLNIQEYWKHCLACGLVMEKICKDDQRGRHFMIGMLHDIGKLALDLKFTEIYSKVLARAQEEERPLHAIEFEELGMTHAEVGQEIILSWNLPSEFAEIIVSHHAPAQGLRNQYVTSLVYLADIAVRMMDIGDSGNPASPVIVDPYARKIGVSIASVLEEKGMIVEQVEALTGSG